MKQCHRSICLLLTVLLCFTMLSGCSGTGTENHGWSYMEESTVIATDQNGINQIGNLPENIQSGGFIAAQGEMMFYTELEKDGGLYAAFPDKEPIPLTDFPVGNLNVVGDRLVFTSLEGTLLRGYAAADGARFCRPASKEASPNAIWKAAETEDAHSDLLYGGTLYVINGISSLAEGNIPPPQRLGAEDTFYYAVSMNQSVLHTIALPAFSADQFSASPTSANTKEVAATLPLSAKNLATQTDAAGENLESEFEFRILREEGEYTIVDLLEGRTLVQAVEKNGVVYLEVRGGETDRILRVTFDSEGKAQPGEELPGRFLCTFGDSIFFVGTQDQYVYELKDGTDTPIGISLVPVDFLQVKDTGELEIVFHDWKDTGLISKNGTYPASRWTVKKQLGEWFNYLKPIPPPEKPMRYRPRRCMIFEKTIYLPPNYPPDNPPTPPTQPQSQPPNEPSASTAPPNEEYRQSATLREELPEQIICEPWVTIKKPTGISIEPPELFPDEDQPAESKPAESKPPFHIPTPEPEITPADALEVELMILRGETDYVAKVPASFDAITFNTYLRYYQETLQYESVLDSIVEELAQTDMGKGEFLVDNSDDPQIQGRDAMAEIIRNWPSMSTYKVGSYEIHEGSERTATVQVEIGACVNLADYRREFKFLALMDLIDRYNKKHNMEKSIIHGFYPEEVAVFCNEILMDMLKNPSSTDFYTTTPRTIEVTMSRDPAQGGWWCMDVDWVYRNVLMLDEVSEGSGKTPYAESSESDS